MSTNDQKPLYRVFRDAPEESESATISADANYDPAASERRYRRNTYVIIALAVLISLIFARWQMTAGIALGGLLSLFNERWLWSGTGAILNLAAQTGNPRLPQGTATKFILRYLIIAIVTGLAVWSRYFDLLGIAIGLASFVGAVMIEAGRELLLTFKR